MPESAKPRMAVIGLGSMGYGMATSLRRAGFEVTGCDVAADSVARFVADAPYASDYTGERIYYRSLRERGEDFLAARDWLWRWDTDWFWCSKNLGAQWPWLRRLLRQ